MPALARTFVNAYQTYEAVMGLLANHQRGAYVRFSDGEAGIMQKNKGMDQHQWYLPGFSSALREAFMVVDPNYLVAPAVAGKQETDERVNKHFPLTRMRWKDLLAHDFFPQQELYSMFWLRGPMFFDHAKVINFLRSVRSRQLGIICGEHIPEKDLVTTFGPNRVIVRGPSKCAYTEIDRMIDEVLHPKQPAELWIMACGATAKILAYHIWRSERPVICIDIGSEIEALSRSRRRRCSTWNRQVDHEALKRTVAEAFA